MEKKSVRSTILELLVFGLFCFVAIMHSLVDSVMIKEYETNISVQQSFGLLTKNIKDETVDNIDQFWLSMRTLRLSVIERESESDFYKLTGSPNYVVSDIRITTRRIKEESNSVFADASQWVTTEFEPFIDAFDEAVEDTEEFVIDSEGTFAQHMIEESHNSLGGFVVNLSLSSTDLEFNDRVTYLSNPENKFLTSATLSVVADILLFNQDTNAFVLVGLKARISAAGLVTYKFEFNKPIG